MNYRYIICLFNIIFNIILGYTMEPFVVENAINTCYIDSLLMGLFYNPSTIDIILNNDLNNSFGIYLQEYIKQKFVKCIRSNKSVLTDDIEMIRVISSEVGWSNKTEYIEQQDVREFYIFIANLFEIEKIEIKRKSIIANSNNNFVGDKEIVPYIPLSLPKEQTITIKKMLSLWQYDNISNIGDNDVLNTYNITNNPLIICLSINRFDNDGKRIHTNVIIQKKIHINEKALNTNSWYFHAAICHKGDTLKSGHYYTLISGDNNRWYIFDDLNVPCVKEVRMDDPEVTGMIKKECFFIIYRRN